MQEENCKQAVEKHISAYGSLEILVNNASKQIMCKAIEDIDVSCLEQASRGEAHLCSSATSSRPSGPTSWACSL